MNIFKRLWNWLCANKYQRKVWKFLALDAKEVSLIRNQLTKIGDFKTTTDEDKINRIKNWIIDHVQYVTDIELFGKVEYWQRPVKTLINTKGDCEDHHLLLISLLTYAGIDKNKLKIVIGKVCNPRGEKSDHCYALYEHQKGNWKVLDTTCRVFNKDVDLFIDGKYVENIFYKEPQYQLTLEW